MVFYLSSYADQYHDLISPSFGCFPVMSRHRKSSASFLLANQALANPAWKSDLHIWFGISFLWFLTQPSTFIQAWKRQLRKHWLVYPQCLESDQGSVSRQLRTALYLQYAVWCISAFWSARPCCYRCQFYRTRLQLSQSFFIHDFAKKTHFSQFALVYCLFGIQCF